MKRISLAIGATLGLAISASAFAACSGLQVATGPEGKGYANIFKDIKSICGSEVPMCEVRTGGGLDNLTALAANEADVGLVQVDTLRIMAAKGNENYTTLKAVIPLNFNYLHVVTSAKGYQVQGERKFGGLLGGDSKTVVIQRFTELRGKTVAVVGSAALMVRALNQSLNYNMQFIDAASDEEAFKFVQEGKAVAAFTVSGWPNGPITKLTTSANLTLIPFDAPVGNPYQVRPLSYKNLAVYNNNTLASPNLLVTRPFKGAKAQEVAKLMKCVSAKLDDLQEGSYQPGWKEVKSFDNTFEWPKFAVPTNAKK